MKILTIRDVEEYLINHRLRVAVQETGKDGVKVIVCQFPNVTNCGVAQGPTVENAIVAAIVNYEWRQVMRGEAR